MSEKKYLCSDEELSEMKEARKGDVKMAIELGAHVQKRLLAGEKEVFVEGLGTYVLMDGVPKLKPKNWLHS